MTAKELKRTEQDTGTNLGTIASFQDGKTYMVDIGGRGYPLKEARKISRTIAKHVERIETHKEKAGASRR